MATRSVLLLLVTLGVWFGGAHSTLAQSVPTRRPATPAGWFHVFQIAERTYAISEPKYWQENVSYLLIGSRRALLFDSGPGLYSIRAEADRLTSLPLIVIPSHLHFDHVGDLDEFSDVRLPDLPGLRRQVQNGYFVEATQQYMLRGVSFGYAVHGFIKDGATIDLGDRVVRLLSTPGHTPDSVSLIDGGGARLFTGDLVNRVATLYAVPGSDVHAAAASLKRLLRAGHPGTLVYEAHAEAALTWPELQQLADGIAGIAGGRGGVPARICLDTTPMQRFAVGPFPVLLTPEGGAAQAPLESATQVLDFGGNACN
jgi:glyoxylase-like metal-dependent hydrolase (beta-lactamase superfamily II)